MAAVEISIESVLSQFSLLDAKAQVKFAAEMTRFLQGSKPKKGSRAKKEVDPDAPKKERSEKALQWNALIASVRSAIKKEHAMEKLSQSVVFNIASQLKVAGNMEPDEGEILALYEKYDPEEHKSPTAVSRAAKKEGSVASAEDSEGEEKPAEKPKKTLSDEQKAKMKAGREAAKAKKDAEKAAEAFAEKPAEKPKAKKVVTPPPVEESEDEEEAPIETVAWKNEGKTYARNKNAPFYCWDIKTMEYAGVWDPETKSFDLSIPDPQADGSDEE